MDEFDNIYQSFSKYNVKELERKEKDFSFSDVYILMEEIFNIVNSLKMHEDFLQSLPISKRNKILQDIGSFIDQMENIRRFNPAIANAAQNRTSIANLITAISDKLDESLIPRLKLHILEENLSKI